MKKVIINHEPVELYKILKFESLVYGGGEAKTVIANGYVQVNGQVQTQKRKKIRDGDIIEFDGERYEVQLACDQQAVQSQSQTPQQQAKPETKPVKKRSAIKF